MRSKTRKSKNSHKSLGYKARMRRLSKRNKKQAINRRKSKKYKKRGGHPRFTELTREFTYRRKGTLWKKSCEDSFNKKREEWEVKKPNSIYNLPKNYKPFFRYSPFNEYDGNKCAVAQSFNVPDNIYENYPLDVFRKKDRLLVKL